MDPLPIKLEGHPAEGGHSLALRTLQRNGLTFSKAAYWLDIPWTKTIRQQHLKRWAWALQIKPEWLAQRIPMRYIEDGDAVNHFMGLTWQGGLRLRGHRPQVCVRCVHQHGYCRAAWDLQLACVCPHHACLLSGKCHRCQRSLQWNRPSIDVCTCLHPLKHVDVSMDVDPMVFHWATWLENRMLNRHTTGDVLFVGIPSAVTPDGMFGILMALGIKECPHQVPSPTLWRQVLSSESICANLTRGLKQLEDGLQTQDWPKLAPMTNEQTLQTIASNHVCSADRDFADFLLRSIFPKEETRRKGPRRKGQLNLSFGGVQ